MNRLPCITLQNATQYTECEINPCISQLFLLPLHPQMKAVQIIERIEAQRNEEQQQVLMRFFKTGKGDYGEGDEFLGLKVPQTHTIVKTVASDTPLNEVPELLQSQ